MDDGPCRGADRESVIEVMTDLSVDPQARRHSLSRPALGKEIVMRKLLLAAASLSMLAGAPALAAPCKDAKGKFTKCPPAAAPKAARCKGANGKFAKCGTPGAKPV